VIGELLFLSATTSNLTPIAVIRMLKAMEVHFTPELEAKLTHLAVIQGRDADELVQDALARYLENESQFLEAVEKGIAAAERGEFIDEEEMDTRVEQMFKS
jgi:predicted transcriptional regulator